MMHNAVMQDSGVEWIGGIPHDWQLDRLKDMVSLRNEKSTEKSDVEDYLELEDLEQGTGRLLSIRNTTNVERAVMKFYKGDVLFCKLRPYLRKYHLATFDGKCTGEILAFKPERIDPKFLLYFIASDGFIKICTAMSYGAKMPRVNYPKQLALLPVCFPSVEEQQAIAQYLDQRCGKLDAIIAIKQQQIKALDALRQSIIYQAVTKGLDASVPLVDSGVDWLGKIPQGWQVDRLKDVVSLRNEKTIEKSDIEDYLELEDMEQGTGRLLSKRSTENVESAVMKFYKGDVLFGKLRPYLQKYYLATFDGKCTGEILAFKPERINPKFLLYFVASDGFIKVCTAMSYGAKMPRVNYPKQLALLLITLPSLAEQHSIADHLDQETQRLNSLKENLSQQISTLEAYKKALIYECVTGKKRINTEILKAG